MENFKMIGRQWLISQQEDSSTFTEVEKSEAIKNNICQRCGSKVEASLPNGKKYCRVCIGIGRLCEGDCLVRYPKEFCFPKIKNGGLKWQGKLTLKQQKISEQLVKNFKGGKSTLVHAVTGAGKTEMLFNLIAECMKEGKRACIATPRIDVVNELYPRFKAAFDIKIGKYHGREFHEPDIEQLIICTTHQLMKFYHAFDLLVIDEVDSFPYVNNPELHFAATKAVKSGGVRDYLTATPTEDLLEEARKGRLCILKLNRRFHGGLLPVPQEEMFIKPFLKREQINSKLLKRIASVIEKKHQLLLFVPRVDEIPAYLKGLKKQPNLKDVKIASVHAADPDRLKKVQAFRDHQFDVLVTTTILERGVTFKGVWVIIVAAEDPIYTTASLVQIAGRVGRDKNDTDGLVLYCYRRYSKQIRDAVKQIKEMNQ